MEAVLRTLRLQASDSSDARGSAALTPAAGAAFDRLDTTVRIAVEYLLPKGVGIFVAHLLLDADIKQVDIPGLGLVEAFVVSLSSIEAFAMQYRQSKDTALRYVDMLEALRIVFRSRGRSATTLSFPLTPWKPSVDALAALEAWQEQDAARDKLQKLAKSVKKRFLLLYGEPSTWPTLYDEVRGTFVDVADQLTHRVSATKRALLRLRIMNLQHRLVGAEGDCLKKGDLMKREWVGQVLRPTQEGDFQHPQEGQNGRLAAQKGDFQNGPGSLNWSVTARPGDLRGAQSAHLAQKGDFSVGQGSAADQVLTQKEDPAVGSRQRHGALTAQEGDLQSGPEELQAPVTAEEGDFHPGLGSSHGQRPAEKEDFQDGQNGTDELISPQRGDFGMAQSGGQPVDQAEKGDFQIQYTLRANQKGDCQEASVTPSFNDNVIPSSLSISPRSSNENVHDSPLGGKNYTSQEAAQVGRSLAAFFEPSLVKMTVEESRRAIGGFVNKCKRASPWAVRAAVIDTLVHDHFPTVDPADTRGRPGKRAAWFHGACEHYRAPDALVPPFVQTWLDTDLSWKEIDIQLGAAAAQYGYAMVEGDRRANLVRSFLCGAWSRQELDEALQQAAERTHRRDGAAPLGKVDAEELARYVMQDGTPYGVTSVEVRLHQGAYVVEVWKGELSLKLATVEDWVNLLTALEQKAQAVEEVQRRRQKT